MPGAGGTVRLPRLVGMGRALDMILTGRPVGAREALEMGLANRIVPDGTSRLAAERLARELATQASTIGSQVLYVPRGDELKDGKHAIGITVNDTRALPARKK